MRDLSLLLVLLVSGVVRSFPVSSDVSQNTSTSPGAHDYSYEFSYETRYDQHFGRSYGSFSYDADSDYTYYYDSDARRTLSRLSDQVEALVRDVMRVSTSLSRALEGLQVPVN